MTTQELEEVLVREKEKAQQALGCDMCKKYARCLYCFSKDEYRCAKAHDRLMMVLERGTRKFPAYLLHEPPLDAAEVKKTAPAPAPKTVRPPAPQTAKEQPAPKQPAIEEESGKEPKEEMVETIAHILSGYDMNSLSEERTQELMKISAILDSTEEDETNSFARAVRTESEANVLSRTARSEGDVPLLVIRKRK